MAATQQVAVAEREQAPAAPPKKPATKAAAKKKPATVTSLKAAPKRAPLPAPVAPVAVGDVNSAIKSLALEHLQCRDFGHSWRPLNARWVPRDNNYAVELRCARCTTLRTRYLGRRGELLDSRYDYPDGYQMPAGMGRLEGSDRDMIRFQSLQSILVVDTVEAD